MSKSPIDTYSLGCPVGGKFYICQGNATQFIGCCTTDPCADGQGTCPQIEPSTFNKAAYQMILPQDCADPKANWYTCSALSTPFMGCCKSNACTNTGGCPGPDLVAAQLGNDTQARYFLTATASASATSSTAKPTGASSTGISAAAATTTAASSSGTAAPASGSPSTTSGLSPGAKAGLGVGAVALVALVGVLFFVIRRALVKRRGVVRGSSPPTTPTTMNYSPARTNYAGKSHPFLQRHLKYVHSADAPQGPNQVAYAALPAKAPSSTITYSPGSSASSTVGSVSREASLRSTATSSNSALGTRSGGSPAAQRPLYHQYGSSQTQFGGYAGSPMGTLAELDGSDVFPSPPISEMAGPTPVVTKRPSMWFRPYRPER